MAYRRWMNIFVSRSFVEKILMYIFIPYHTPFSLCFYFRTQQAGSLYFY